VARAPGHARVRDRDGVVLDCESMKCAAAHEESNPNDSHLFVFVGKRRDMIKILERGRFQLSVIDEKRVKVEMEAAQLAMLLDGID
jgi:hypothetical protein